MCAVMYVWMLMPQYTYGGQRKILYGWFSPIFMWLLGLEFRLPALMTSTCTLWDLFPPFLKFLIYRHHHHHHQRRRGWERVLFVPLMQALMVIQGYCPEGRALHRWKLPVCPRRWLWIQDGRGTWGKMGPHEHLLSLLPLAPLGSTESTWQQGPL